MGRITHEKTFLGFNLSESRKNDRGFFIDILEAIHKVFLSMSKRRSRIFFTLLVVKFPTSYSRQEPKDNRLISEFMERFIETCEDKRFSPMYVWVRERSSTDQIHYHLMLLLDANKIWNAYGLIDFATEIWRQCLGIPNAKGLVHLCEYNEFHYKYGGIKIYHNSISYFDDLKTAFYKASYLAKVYSKEDNPAGVRRYGRTKIYGLDPQSQFTQRRVVPRYR